MKKRIFAALLCVFMLTSMFATISVSADAVIDRVSLANNLSYYSSAVPEGTKLTVDAYDASGNPVSLEGKEVTFNSESPWIVDVNENGTLIDNTYLGVTKITATVDGVTGGFFLIKTDGDGPGSFNRTFLVHDADETYGNADHAYTIGSTSGYLYKESAGNAKVTQEADDASWYSNRRTDHYGNRPASGSLLLQARTLSWDVQGGIRLNQFWFYDDGTSALDVAFTISQSKSSMANAGHGVIAAWQTNSSVAYYWYGQLGAAAGGTSYTTTAPTKSFNTIERTVGWHQATTIVGEDGSIKTYIDDKELLTAGFSASDGALSFFGTQTKSAGRYDDFVIAQNPNPKMPADYKLPAKSISLRENTSFYLNEVPAGTKLIVTPVDENGDVGKFETEPTYTYTSSRPWVLDIAADGTIVDGGYDGSTNVTVTASFENGQQYTASLIFIVASDNGYNAGEALGGKLYRETTNGYSYINGYVGRTNLSLSSSTKPTTGGHDNGDYIAKGGTKGSSQDDSAALAGVGISWDVTAKIRLMQGWFYDDGASEFEMYFDASAAENSAAYINEGFIESWPNYAYGRAYRHRASIVAAENSTAYSLNDLDNSNNVVYPINRSKGWHQATLVINSNGTINYFIDGKALADTKLGANGSGHPQLIRILGRTPGNYDDFVMVSNENLTEPADYNTVDIAVDCGANGTVSYGGEVVSESVKVKNGANAEFTITPATGYVIDRITYGDDVLTDTEGKVTVVAKAATLTVTFKEEERLPSVGTASYLEGITYITIDNGNVGNVTEAGVIFGAEGVTEMLKLIGYSEYNNDTEKGTPIVSGSFAIKANVSGVKETTTFTAQPFVTYTKDGAAEDAVYAEKFEQVVSPN